MTRYLTVIVTCGSIMALVPAGFAEDPDLTPKMPVYQDATTIFARGEVICIRNQARGHLVDPSERISRVLMLDPLGSAPFAAWPADLADDSQLIQPEQPDRLLTLLLGAGITLPSEDLARMAQTLAPELVVTDVRLLAYRSWTYVTLVVENLGNRESAPVRLDAFVNPSQQPRLGEYSRTHSPVPAIPAKGACLVEFWVAKDADDVRLLTLVLNNTRAGRDLIEWNNVVNAYWM